MQGRLSPPANGAIQCFPASSWQAEFVACAELGLGCIEWIVDDQVGNPLWDAVDIAAVNEVIARTGVVVRSLCADIFMQELPLAHGPARLRATARSELVRLLGIAAGVGASRIVLPFVDSAALESEEDLAAAIAALAEVAPHAHRHGVELHLETSLPPVAFGGLLKRIADPLVKVNYDMGNSAALGYDPAAEFAAYGASVGSVHIKDRQFGGSTVPLGTGATDFAAVFGLLLEQRYGGDLILQAARGDAGDEVGHLRRCLSFLEPFLEQAGMFHRVD